MDDRELLERAAKAAGIALVAPVEKLIVQFDERHKGGFIVMNAQGGHSAWNPLTDDGDALRLAVKLGLVVSVDYKLGLVFCTSIDRETYQAGEGLGDPYAATRRAIVRAAAAMGGE